MEEEIKQLEEAVKRAPEPLMDENFLYKEDTKKIRKLEQEELILEQEKNDRMRLEELQKLKLAADMELIQH